MRVGLLSLLFLLGVAVGGGGVFAYSYHTQVEQRQAIASQLGYANGILTLAREICPVTAQLMTDKLTKK